jgi:hypothetical protein
MPALRDRVAKVLLLLACALAIGRVATAKPPADGQPITPDLARRAYRTITSRERGMRRDSAVSFPGDVWSQDDDFHSSEDKELRTFAASNDTRVVDILRALDDGMKEGWPTAGTPSPKVPPCRPRLSY